MSAPAPRLRLEAALLAALASTPGQTERPRLMGMIARARLATPGYLQLLDHETAVRAALRRLDAEGWLVVTCPGSDPRYALSAAGEQRWAWHRAQGTLQ